MWNNLTPVLKPDLASYRRDIDMISRDQYKTKLVSHERLVNVVSNVVKYLLSSVPQIVSVH